MLAKRDFGSLSKRQKNALMRHFLFVVAAPDWIMKYACRQWPVDASEDRPKLILKSQTVLLTYQGDWGLLDLGPDLPLNPTTSQLTAYVRALPEAKALWTAFSLYGRDLAVDLHAPAYACCLEICMKTFEQEKVLRLHADVYMRNEVQEIRTENQLRLRFKHADPHLKDILWGKKTARSNWAGAYYCLAPKLGSLYQCGSVERFKDFPVDPSWVFNKVEAEKMAYQEAKTELIRCGKGLVRRLADLECWHRNRQDLLVHDMVQSAQTASRESLQKIPRMARRDGVVGLGNEAHAATQEGPGPEWPILYREDGVRARIVHESKMEHFQGKMKHFRGKGPGEGSVPWLQ